MLDLSDVEDRLDNLNESVQILTAGLVELSGGLGNQMKMLTNLTTLVTELKELLTAKPEGESPLVTTLKQLLAINENQSASLSRIESAVIRQGHR